MAEDEALTRDFDAHALFTFAEIPDSPALANRIARTKRWFTIAFAESWLAVLLFRMKKRLRAAGVPFIPGVCDVLGRALFGVQIGNEVDIGPGLMITHGHVVIDGRTTIGRRCQINPWVTIGLSNSKRLGFSIDGPAIGDYVHIGTGAKVLGPISIGDHARIGANAVVVHDVPANTTVVGIPARPIGGPRTPSQAAGDGSGRDERLARFMRNSIVEYRLHRQSLRSLLESLRGSFEIASDGLRASEVAMLEEFRLLESQAANGNGEGDQTAGVIAALESIDRRLQTFA